MGIKISISNSKFNGSESFNRMKISGYSEENTEILLNGVDAVNSPMFNDLDVDLFCEKIQREDLAVHMSKEEYASLQQILKDHASKKTTLQRIAQHVCQFTQGVVSSLVADMIKLR